MMEHSTDLPKSVCALVYSTMSPEIGTQASNFPCSEMKNTNLGSSPGMDGVCSVIGVGVNWAVTVGDGTSVDVVVGEIVGGVVGKGPD